MKVLNMTVVVLGILMASSFAFAQDIDKEAFYAECVDRFVESGEHKASMMGSTSTNIRRDAAIGSMKAAYYKTHKEELVDQMCSQDLKVKRGVADHFLVKSFYRFCEADLARSLAKTFHSMTIEGGRQIPTRMAKQSP